MIERDFVKQKKKEHQLRQFISANLKNVGHSYTELQRTPLGEKVIIHTSRPGLIVGRKGQNIGKLTKLLMTEFKLENPQVEISEVENPDLVATIVGERIASALERFGSNRFKGIMHKTMADVIAAGARGVEIRLSGKLPGARAKSWRIYGGYLKKCGDAATMHVSKACVVAKLKSGIIGIQISIMPPGVIMPDHIKIIEPEEAKTEKEETEKKDTEKVKKEKVEEKKAEEPDKKTEKKTKTKKKVAEPKTKESDAKKTDEK
ncbi:30S ribosomal protein S3 [Candidatus Woesearchaeota archaeon]|nr:30S ribosomal protein S3 [Candidatus Woesearchaeota archaeon]|tara:strand:+ start:13046 stop:13828 length:783 start_codon:yes stop_codon:yes gene_type:complete